MTELNKKEIKTLIKKGFDLELISFELDIPIEEIKQMKNDLEKDDQEENNSSYQMMLQLRKKYQKIFFGLDEKVKQLPKELSPKEVKEIEETIEFAKSKIMNMNGLLRSSKRKYASEIIKKVNKLEQYPLNMDYLEEIYFLLESEQLNSLKVYDEDPIEYRMKKVRMNIFSKLVNAIEIEVEQTNDIDELNRLNKKLTLQMAQRNPILVNSVQIKIREQIQKLKEQDILRRMKSDIPQNIEEIIISLSQGTLDLEWATNIVQEEARKRVEAAPKTRFSLTEERQKKQIFVQIRTALEGNADEYPITDPSATIRQLYELRGGEVTIAISTVVRNLIMRKEFVEAKELCDKFQNKKQDKSFSAVLTSLKKEIRNAEIGDIVLRGINMKNATHEQESTYFNFIQRIVQREDVKLTSIPLGKNKDGTQNITLADIWEFQQEKEK